VDSVSNRPTITSKWSDIVPGKGHQKHTLRESDEIRQDAPLRHEDESKASTFFARQGANAVSELVEQMWQDQSKG
jgi:hypothetical protein